MKNKILLLIITSICLPLLKAQDANYFIKFKNNISIEKIKKWQSSKLEYAQNLRIEKYFISQTGSISKVYGLYGESKLCEIFVNSIGLDTMLDYVELNPDYRIYFTPNDFATSQYNLTKISAKNAWNYAKGISKIKVAVVDDAVELNHSDLKNVIWNNLNEIAGNGIDDDLNGYVDDVVGWDAADGDNDPNPPSSPGFDHGTHCAGIVGAETNNNNGIASIGFGISLMAVKISSSSSGFIINAAKGVEYAIINNASVISMSWGGAGFSRTYQLLFDLAASNDIVCVAAAGNSSSSSKFYPAGYNNVIAVASTTSTDAISSFSNYGNWIDVCAPGSSIYSTITNNFYGTKSGTSMACPLVSGLCGLLRSKNPTFSAIKIENCLKNTCDNINSVNPSYVGLMGFGRINAENAVLCVKSLIAVFESNKTQVCPGDTIVFKNKSKGNPVVFKWQFSGGNPSTSADSIVKVVYNTAGIYNVKFWCSDGIENDSIEFKKFITVAKPSAFFSQKTMSVILGNSVALPIKCKGVPKFIVTVSDSSNTYSITLNDTVNYAIFIPTKSTTYKITSISDANCSATILDSIRVTVTTGAKCIQPRMYFDITQRISGATINPHAINWWKNNIIVSGKITGVGAGSSDAFVARFDDTGKLIWFKTVGGTGSEDVLIKHSISATGKILLTYRTYSFNNSYGASAATIFDINGNLISQGETKYNGRTFYETYNANFISTANKFIAVGLNAQYVTSFFGVTLNEFDSTGNVSFHRVFTTSYWTYTNGAAEALGGYIIGGDIRDANERSFLMKTSKTGTRLWSYRSNANFLEKIIHVKIRSNGDIYGYGIAIPNSGFGSIDLILHCFDSTGSIKWSKIYGSSANEYCGGIVDDGSGLIMVAQTNSYDGGNKHKIVFKTDYNGIILWSYLIGSYGKNYEYSGPGSPDLALHDQLGLVVYAEDVSSSTGIELFSMSNCGETGCKSTALKLNSSAVSVSFSALNMTTSTTGGIASINQTIKTQSSNRIINCTSKVNSTQKKPKKCRLNADFAAIIPICNLDSVRFDDLSVDTNKQKTIQRIWNFGDGNIVSSKFTKSMHFYKNSGNYNVTLIVTTSDTTVCIDTVSKVISITSNPFIVTKNGTRICKGDSLQLDVIRTSCFKGKLKYLWSPNTGLNQTNIANPKAAPSVNTTYTVKITDENGLTATDTVKVDVNQLCCKKPSGIVIPPPPYCEGGTFKFDAKPDSVAGFFYRWTINNVRLSKFNDPSKITLKNVGVGQLKIKCRVESSCGFDSTEITLAIEHKPKITIFKDSTICQNALIGFKASNYDLNKLNWSSPEPITKITQDSVQISFTKSSFVSVISTDRFTGCSGNDTAFVTKTSTASIFTEDTVAICSGDSALVSLKLNNEYWKDGFINKNRWLKQKGSYIAGITTNKCQFYDTLNIRINPKPSIINLKDTGFCLGDSVLIKINTSDSIKWFDFKNSKSRMFKNPGSYNYTVINKNNCRISDTFKINQFQKIRPDLGNDTFLCINKSMNLNVKNYVNNWKLVWDNNTSNPTRVINTAGQFYVSVTDGKCNGADTINVALKNPPNVDLGPDSNICEKSEIILQNSVLNSSKQLWDNGLTTKTRRVDKVGKYWLKNTNECGSATDSIMIYKRCNTCELYFPNSFTPYNFDNLNDTFKLVSTCIPIKFNLRIYNRWGQEVFRSNNINQGWNGYFNNKKCQIGNYTWFVEIKFPNTETPLKTYRGPLIIIGNEK